MLSRPQQILLKRAQREAGLQDLEYRDALAAVSGCRSSTDPKLTDRHVDLALAFFEAIYWRGVDAGTLQPPGSAHSPFRRRGYWSQKNGGGATSRDRYNEVMVTREIRQLEAGLAALGFGPSYVAGIQDRVTHGDMASHSLHLYKAALQRTLAAKQRAICSQ
jgi:hypothetical protein